MALLCEEIVLIPMTFTAGVVFTYFQFPKLNKSHPLCWVNLEEIPAEHNKSQANRAVSVRCVGNRLKQTARGLLKCNLLDESHHQLLPNYLPHLPPCAL